MDNGFAARGLWRFSGHLPITDPSAIVSLGEGETPLVASSGPTLAALPVRSVHLKAEYQNPTGSFKDRIAAVAAALIRQGGLTGAVGTSSGNGGAAIAAYGAKAAFPVVLFTGSGIVDGKLSQILAHGAATHLVDSSGAPPSDEVAPTIAGLAEEMGWYPFLTGGRYAPEAMRGAETIAFELAEEIPAASAVYVPVGGGGLLASIWRGYKRLGNGPRLVGVQPRGCPTLTRGLSGVLDPLPERVSTSVSGLQVPVLFDYDAVTSVTESGGSAVEVTDEQAWASQAILAREEGIFVEPAGAVALAGVLADAAAGRLRRNDDVVVILSGAGHKDARAVERLASRNRPVEIDAKDIEEAFRRVRATR